MRIYITILLLISAYSVSADNICPINSEIPDDVRIKESQLTKENAEKSIKLLEDIVSGENKKYSWVTIPNSFKTIEGYVLKRDTLKNSSGVPDFDKTAFCNYMKKGYWYD